MSVAQAVSRPPATDVLWRVFIARPDGGGTLTWMHGRRWFDVRRSAAERYGVDFHSVVAVQESEAA